MFAITPSSASRGDVGRVGQLQVRDVVPVVVRAVRGAGRRDRVERRADRAVAQRVLVELEPLGVEPDRRLAVDARRR